MFPFCNLNKNINVNVSDPLLSRSVAEEIAAMEDEEEASRSERDAPKEPSEPSEPSSNPATTLNNPTFSESVINVEVHPQPSTDSTAGAEALPASTFGN